MGEKCTKCESDTTLFRLVRISRMNVLSVYVFIRLVVKVRKVIFPSKMPFVGKGASFQEISPHVFLRAKLSHLF